jgi:hypothetical protein
MSCLLALAVGMKFSYFWCFWTCRRWGSIYLDRSQPSNKIKYFSKNIDLAALSDNLEFSRILDFKTIGVNQNIKYRNFCFYRLAWEAKTLELVEAFAVWKTK